MGGWALYRVSWFIAHLLQEPLDVLFPVTYVSWYFVADMI
jgi:hypothetical protein